MAKRQSSLNISKPAGDPPDPLILNARLVGVAMSCEAQSFFFLCSNNNHWSPTEKWLVAPTTPRLRSLRWAALIHAYLFSCSHLSVTFKELPVPGLKVCRGGVPPELQEEVLCAVDSTLLADTVGNQAMCFGALPDFVERLIDHLRTIPGLLPAPLLAREPLFNQVRGLSRHPFLHVFHIFLFHVPVFTFSLFHSNYFCCLLQMLQAHCERVLGGRGPEGAC